MSDDAERLVPSFEHRREDDLPEGWTYLALGNAGAWGSGGTPSKSRAEFWDRGTVPWVSPKDMKVSFIGDAQDHITQHAVSSGAAGLVPAGTILFVVRGMILAHTFPVALTTREVAFNQDMRSILPDATLHPPYLLRVLQHEAMTILFAVKEATHGTLRLDSDTLRPWPVPVPPLAEQHRIVEAVDALLEQVNRARGRLNRVPLILRRFRQAVLAAACSGRLTEEWRQAHPSASADPLLRDLAAERVAGRGEIEIPSSWAWARFASLVDNHDGTRVPVKSTDREKRRGRYSYYGASGAIDTIDDFLFEGTFLLIGEDGANLLSRSTPIAFTATGQFWVNNHAHVVQTRGGVVHGFLEAQLNSIDLQDYVTGTAQPKLTQAALNGIPLALPPTDEQEEVFRRVRALFALADAIEARVRAASARADKLPQAILSKAFSGDSGPDGGRPRTGRGADVRDGDGATRAGGGRQGRLDKAPAHRREASLDPEGARSLAASVPAAGFSVQRFGRDHGHRRDGRSRVGLPAGEHVLDELRWVFGDERHRILEDVVRLRSLRASGTSYVR